VKKGKAETHGHQQSGASPKSGALTPSPSESMTRRTKIPNMTNSTVGATILFRTSIGSLSTILTYLQKTPRNMKQTALKSASVQRMTASATHIPGISRSSSSSSSSSARTAPLQSVLTVPT